MRLETVSPTSHHTPSRVRSAALKSPTNSGPWAVGRSGTEQLSRCRKFAGASRPAARAPILDPVEPCFTALIGGIDATLDGRDTALAGVAPTARAVPSDDSRELRPTLYAEGGPIAAAILLPHRAVTLAGELIAAARRRML